MKARKFLSQINLIRKIVNKTKQLLLIKKYYSFRKNRKSKPCLVFCVDGRLKHGGLSDRFLGCLTTYALCKTFEIDFKILYTYPFNITDYFQPNLYDWQINDHNISYCITDSVPIVRLGDEKWLKSFRKLPTKQIHFYSNYRYLNTINKYYSTNFEYNILFNELFKLSDPLQKKLDDIRSKYPEKYISICFRFQNSFGDFEEANSAPLSKDKRTILTNNCLSAINRIKEMNNDIPILITSDSITFLKIVSSISNIYIIPGEIVHMDYIQNAQFETYEKSFIDLYMLGGGIKVIQFKMEFLLQSGFPFLAAKLNGKEYLYIDYQTMKQCN